MYGLLTSHRDGDGPLSPPLFPQQPQSRNARISVQVITLSNRRVFHRRRLLERKAVWLSPLFPQKICDWMPIIGGPSLYTTQI